ncbi:sulfurtransferase [Lacticaseibacillus casei]|uniref:Rhodanese-like domain-containing protein n=1 Tax=Lacticaseibacillus zeae TaxID=57037 RepID=A0A5R8M182_LACZE|nr:rhodanese-like domain-containing protein [Lacticaseibacillus zeae]OLS10877.1 sulfurtransferase [Lacticaseibacillus casei]QVI31239.1 rhodanese-like domain-containing protein [Lacticaseibacillus zeae]TLF42009.1 rhodanese-like domain-containing protein [Lacticaseibacillus zeae]
MEQAKVDLLKTYLSLYIDHFTVLKALNAGDDIYEILDVRNAPAQAKKVQIKGAHALPAKDLASQVDQLDHDKTYVVYDWTAGTTLGKQALLILLTHGFKAFELAGALEGWRGMNLPVEPVQ